MMSTVWASGWAPNEAFAGTGRLAAAGPLDVRGVLTLDARGGVGAAADAACELGHCVAVCSGSPQHKHEPSSCRLMSGNCLASRLIASNIAAHCSSVEPAFSHQPAALRLLEASREAGADRSVSS